MGIDVVLKRLLVRELAHRRDSTPVVLGLPPPGASGFFCRSRSTSNICRLLNCHKKGPGRAARMGARPGVTLSRERVVQEAKIRRPDTHSRFVVSTDW